MDDDDAVKRASIKLSEQFGSNDSFTRLQFACDKPRVKVGLGDSRTIADSQWNPVYIAFHQFFCCGNETICR